ncbi:uncharacterized protein rab11fip5a isoform X2 [Hippocampus comes]|uniref:uncharacterized protein rab11fip5a isoform X2 n=1 Tax=Hippocampus comes TaxID=109280 RepID=UPI00094E3858|nr:PREDICTED: uncharacterized protein LOC109528168 isoform X2 [Hippocampus comes]
MEQPWVPTHVQVTVLRGRGLRGKGKHGTSDVYAVIQLAKEKYSTCVAEKTTEPEWREECCFELQPGVLETDGGPELVLTVMHRAVIGLDVFLGQALIQLRKLFHESRGVKNQWYRLNSKTGKKEKERGDIQVSVQFTRNNLTASMYDLVMKDKGGASTFSKLKERMRGKRRSSEDDLTLAPGATLPGGTGPLCRMRQRLPSDGGGEEDYEDDEGGEVRRSKMRTFFLRGKLRKSSDTRSSTSLGSESSESSSRGGSLSPTAGISVVVSDLSNSPSNSSNLTADSPDHTADTSPKLSPLHCDFRDEISEITIAVPQLPAGVNGTHKLQPRDQASAVPETSLGPGHLEKSLPLSVSLQNLRPRASADPLHGTVGDGRRWSFDKAGEEESAAIAAAMEKKGPIPGREDQCEEGEQYSGTEGKHKGWFGSRESHSKPSPVAPLKLDPTPEPPLNQLHNSNPFCPSPPMSPSNPFLSDPFCDTSLPPLPFLSSSRPPIEQLFPKPSHPVTQTWDSQTTEGHVTGLITVASPTFMGQTIPLSKTFSNPFTSAEEPQHDTGWDNSFDDFAHCRLQGPKDQTSDSLASTHQRELGSNERNDSLNTKGITLSNYMANCSRLPSLEPIPEDSSLEVCNEVFHTSAISAESRPHPEWHDANSTTNMPPCFLDPAGSSGIVSSAEDDFPSRFSYSASEKFSACSSDETELQNFERVGPASEILAQTGISPKGYRSTDELLNDEAQQTVIQNEDLEQSFVFPPPPTMSTAMMTDSEAADMQMLENMDLQPKSNVIPQSDNNDGVPQGEFSGQPPLYIRTSSPGTDHSSSFEDPAVPEHCWESPVPFRDFGDLDQSTNSFVQSIHVAADSQYYQNCSSLPPLEYPGISKSAENSTFCGELGQIREAIVASVSPDEPTNQSDHWGLMPENRPETGETGFTVKNERSSQVLPATDMFPYPVEGNEFSSVDVQIVKNPPPQLPEISQDAGSFLQSINGNLQFHQNHYGISEPPGTLDSEKSSFFGEPVEISEFQLSLVMADRPDIFEPGFSARDDESPQVLSVTHTDSYHKPTGDDQSTDHSDLLLKNTPPQLLKISQGTRSFLQNLDSNLDYHQNHNEPTERIDLEKFAFSRELGEIPEPTYNSMIPGASPSEPNNREDSFSLVTENRADTCEPDFTEDCDLGFTARNDGSSQVIPVTPTDSYPNAVEGDQFTVLDDVFVNKPLPELSYISQSTGSFPQSLDGNLQDHYGISKLPETDRPDTHVPGFTDACESTFTERDDGASQVLSATSTDSNPKPVKSDQVTAFDDMLVKNPPPRLPQIFQRTMSVPSFLLSENRHGVSKSAERRPLEKSISFGKVGEVPEDTGSSLSRRSSTSGPYVNTHITDWLTQVMKDRLDTGFNGGDHGSSQVLPTTPVDSKADEVVDTAIEQNPLPQHPALNRSHSESTLAFELDKTLTLSFWNESCAPQASSASPASPSLSTASAPPLTRQSSCFPSFLSSLSDVLPPSATTNLLEAQECQQQHVAHQEHSPHPVRPLSGGPLAEGRSVLEKIKSSIHPGRSSQTGEKILTEGAGSYYHLTHNELIGLLVRREAELERQKAEFQQQRALLAKREVELCKLKPQVRDLEDYIDTLLVRIMEQKPTLLQVRSRLK